MLVRTTKGRPAEKRLDEDYDVHDASGQVLGRIFRSNVAPQDRRWFWCITSRLVGKPIAWGYAATRDDARDAFKKEWRRQTPGSL